PRFSQFSERRLYAVCSPTTDVPGAPHKGPLRGTDVRPRPTLHSTLPLDRLSLPSNTRPAWAFPRQRLLAKRFERQLPNSKIPCFWVFTFWSSRHRLPCTIVSAVWFSRMPNRALLTQMLSETVLLSPSNSQMPLPPLDSQTLSETTLYLSPLSPSAP